jgi:hypothetical protein
MPRARSECPSGEVWRSLVLQDDVEGVDDSWNVTQDGQPDVVSFGIQQKWSNLQDVDEQVGITSSLKEDTDGWDEDGEDDLDDV